MRISTSLILPMLTLSAAAQAECVPKFVDRSSSVNLIGSSDFDNSQVREQASVAIENRGDSACSLTFTIRRDVAAADPEFPAYTISGPTGAFEVLPDSVGNLATDKDFRFTLEAGARLPVPIDFQSRLGWGMKAGTYSDQLVLALADASGAELDSITAAVLIDIPPTARIRFAGPAETGRTRSIPQIDLGILSMTQPTQSLPFALRVLSTSPYVMSLSSENHGVLLKDGGSDTIAYRMQVGGQNVSLAGDSFSVTVADHTSVQGDIHPVVVTVDPDPLRPAGVYRDRITVAVTPI